MSTLDKNRKTLSEDAKELSEIAKQNNILSEETLKNEAETNKILEKRGNIYTEQGRQIREMQKTRHGIHETYIDEINARKELNKLTSDYGEMSEIGIKALKEYAKKFDEIAKAEKRVKNEKYDPNDEKAAKAHEEKLAYIKEEREELDRMANSTYGKNMADKAAMKEMANGNEELLNDARNLNNIEEGRTKYLKEQEAQTTRLTQLEEEKKKKAEELNKTWSVTTQIGGSIFSILKETLMFYADFEDKVVKSGRAIGFSNNQIQGQMAQTAKDISTIGVKYGATTDEIIAMQGRVAKATGRAVVMSYTQKDAMMSNSKIFGEQITDTTIEKMDNMGAGIEQAGAQLKAIQEGARYAGIDASKYAQDFTSNLEWAQKNVNFKDGINGVRKMTEQSEVLKINMQSILSAAEKMNNVQGAIESSAKMQMLGGNFARNFSDPMRVMYESQSDPQALFNRIIDSVKGMSSFNMKTGQSETNYFGRASLKAASEASGIDYNELLQASQTKAKLNALGSQMNGNLTEEQKTAIADRAQLNTKTGRYEVSWYDKNGATKPKDISQMTAADIQAMTDSAKQSKDINGNVYQITEFQRDTKENLQAIVNRIWPELYRTMHFWAEKFNMYLNKIINFWDRIPGWIKWIGGLLVVSSTARGIVSTAAGLAGKHTIGWGLLNGGKKTGNLWQRLWGKRSFNSIFKKGEKATGEAVKYGEKALKDYGRVLEEGGNATKIGKKVVDTEEVVGKASKLSKAAKAIKWGGGITDAALAGYSIYEAYKSEKEEENANKTLSSDIYLNRAKGGFNGMDNTTRAIDIGKIVDKNREKNANMGTAIGSVVGIAANAIPIIGPLLSGIISIAGPYIGRQIGLLVSKKSTTVVGEEQAKERINTYWDETSKFGKDKTQNLDIVGQATVKSSDVLSSIYQLLFSRFDTKGQEAMNRKMERDKINKNDTAALKEFDENDHFKLFNWNTWFNHWGRGYATGGIVHANSGALINGRYEQGDRELVAANSGEMILNKKQQGALFSFINKLYDSPTEIAKRTASINSVGYNSGNLGGTFNLTLNGTIKLDAGGQKYDFKALMNDSTFVKELSNIIVKQMSKNMNGKFDKNNPVSRTQSYTFRRGVGYNNA